MPIQSKSFTLISGYDSMFKALFGSKSLEKHAHALYGAVVARSRDRAFYEDFGVPDTFDGRFELLAMHLFMVHARLQGENAEARDVSQRVFDNFINDMDAALREAAVGDQTVPKRIGKMTQVFYGRSGAYAAALAGDDHQRDLEAVIARNMYAEDDPNGREKKLARYMDSESELLKATPTNDIVRYSRIFNQPLNIQV